MADNSARSCMSRFTQTRIRERCCVSTALLLLFGANIAQAGNTIYVTSLQQKISETGGCSLQEAIHSANFDDNKAIDSTNPDHFITTECVAGNGDDTILLPPGAVLQMSRIVDDAYNPMGPTANPIVFSNIIIEAEGSRLEHLLNGRDFRAFAVGQASVDVGSGNVKSGTGNLTIRNAYIKGFTARGGDGATGGGGGLGAGGAIYVKGGTLTVENCTLESNGVLGGNGSTYFGSGPGGGGGGLAGNGGFANGDLPELNRGGGGGGGGSRGDGGNAGVAGQLAVFFHVGGGGGGTVANGDNPAGGADGGFACGGNGGHIEDDGSDALCAGGGGGGGGTPTDDLVTVLGGDGGHGGYGGGGGGAGYDTATIGGRIGRSGGHSGFGGGGGGGSHDKGGGDGDFGGGGGRGASNIGDDPGEGGSFAGNASVDAGGGGAGLGGAIFNHGGNVTIRNSTFTGNFVVRGEGGSGGLGGTPAANGTDAGGAIFSVAGSLTVVNSTIASNGSTGNGGGIVVYRPTTGEQTNFTLRNTIIADSIPGARECFFIGSVAAVGSGNLIENNFGCPGMVQSGDPQLGALQLNAPGSTPTMEIPLTSPAVDTADAPTSLLTDQRGVVRPLNEGFDIGAFEAREPAADLRVVKIPSSQTAIPGDLIPFSIFVANDGPDNATAVQVTDNLPSALTLVQCVPQAFFGTCSVSGNNLTVSYAALPVGSGDSTFVSASLNYGVPDGTVITNTASVSAASPADPNPADNTNSATITVQNRSDLLLTQSVAKLANRQLRYTINVRNLGPYEARVIELNDPIPNGTKFVSVAQGLWSCTPLPAGSVGTLSCSLPRLSLNANAGLSFIVKTTAPGSVNIGNTATASPATFDPNLANNSATLITRVSGK